MIDPKDLRVGDRVLVEAVVFAPLKNDCVVLAAGNGLDQTIYSVRPGRIHSILSCALAATDRVKIAGGAAEGVILHIDEDCAFVKWGPGSHVSHELVRACRLERAS